MYEDTKIKSWAVIAKALNKHFDHRVKNGKQCRDRYINFIKPMIYRTETKIWSAEEDDILFDRYREYGSKWASIS